MFYFFSYEYSFLTAKRSVMESFIDYFLPVCNKSSVNQTIFLVVVLSGYANKFDGNVTAISRM